MRTVFCWWIAVLEAQRVSLRLAEICADALAPPPVRIFVIYRTVSAAREHAAFVARQSADAQKAGADALERLSEIVQSGRASAT